MKKKVFLIALALIVLTLIVISSVIQPPPPQEIFEKLMGFLLPETAEFVRYAYNRVTQEGLFDIRLSPAEYETVMADLETALGHWAPTAEGDSPSSDLEYVLGDLATVPPIGGTNFPRLYWFMGKSIRMMSVDVLREKQSGYYRLQIDWFR